MNFSVAALASALVAALWAAGLAAPAAAAIHHVQAPGTPAAGTPDGSPGAPWPSLSAALAGGAVRGGDEIRLAPGDYGEIAINGAQYDRAVLIGPDSPGTVHLAGLSVARSRNLTISGLGIWPDGPGRGPLVEVAPSAGGIVLRGLDVRSRADADTYPGWSRRDWEQARRGGVRLQGPDGAVLDSRFTAMAFAISTTGPRARVAGNLVQGFSGDGLRGLGDGSVFEGNRVQDCVQIDGNHADAFQSWSRGEGGRSGRGVVRDLVLRGNLLIEWAQPRDNPLRCALQGIGLFDGMYEGLVIENNLILVSGYHGIAVAGARDARIVNNTLVNPREPGANSPWLSVTPHKRGQPSSGIVVANNVGPRFRLVGIDPSGLVDSANVIGVYAARVLADPSGGRFEPLPGGPLVDGGDARYAPATDLAGRRRDARPDIGAFEAP